MILDAHGHQGWSLITILHDIRCAFHRNDNCVNPWEVWCLTMLACADACASAASDMGLLLSKRQVASDTFAILCNANCLSVGIATGRMVIGRLLIHHLEKSANPACRPRRLREYIRDTSVLILDGGVLKESSKDCFTHAVLQQLARNPTFVAGLKSSGQLASLGWMGHEHWALETLAEARATMRGIHAGLRQIFSEEWLQNAFEAFDIHVWMQVDDAKGAMPVKRKCMIACFRKLAIAKKCQPCEGH